MDNLNKLWKQARASRRRLEAEQGRRHPEHSLTDAQRLKRYRLREQERPRQAELAARKQRHGMLTGRNLGYVP